jgi:hypothetical protein
MQQVAELGEVGRSNVGLSVGDLRQIIAALAGHGLQLRHDLEIPPSAMGAPRRDPRLSERNAAIVSARERGHSLREIGASFGLSFERVRQILVEAHAADPGRAKTARAKRQVLALLVQREEALAAFRAGGEYEVIAAQLGISAELLRLLVSTQATAADRAARRLARAENTSARVHLERPATEVIKALKRVAEEPGRVPTGDEYAQSAQATGLPSLATAKNRFGGWNAALRAAGLEPRREHPRSYERPWTEEACLEALRRLSVEEGALPSQRQYERLSIARADLPSMTTVRTNVGPWSWVVLQIQASAPASHANSAA